MIHVYIIIQLMSAVRGTRLHSLSYWHSYDDANLQTHTTINVAVLLRFRSGLNASHSYSWRS